MRRAASGPSRLTAPVRLAVPSGHTVVHSESTKVSTTALPRNWDSETRWPNWSVSVKPGAGRPGITVPGSTPGLCRASGWPAALPGAPDAAGVVPWCCVLTTR